MEYDKPLKTFYREVKKEIISDENLLKLSRMIENPQEGKTVYLPYYRKNSDPGEKDKPISLTKALCLIKKEQPVEFKPFVWVKLGVSPQAFCRLKAHPRYQPVTVNHCEQFNRLVQTLLRDAPPVPESPEQVNRRNLLNNMLSGTEELRGQAGSSLPESREPEINMSPQIQAGLQPWTEGRNGAEKISYRRAYDLLAQNQPVYFKPITWDPGDSRPGWHKEEADAEKHLTDLNNYEAIYRRSLSPNEGKDARQPQSIEENLNLDELYRLPRITPKRQGFFGEWALSLSQERN